MRDYGASGKGDQDDAPYIMKAVVDGDHCGANCNATSTKGAVIYFPPGTYRISSPILQYYYTIFVGDPHSPAIIKGAKDFKGIALIDTDFYVPNGNANQWWTNQNNFYRQIRNFKLDMSDMPSYVEGGAVDNWPVGIHWQVSQACTLQNIQITMPLIGQKPDVRHRGIFMENGSGGNEVSFVGGRVGFVAGNQQYTARKLRFTSMERAIDMLWDWGFVWKSIEVVNCRIGINATAGGRDENTKKMQSTGSLTILDSSFKDVENMLVVGGNIKGYQPNVVVDNVKLDSVTKSAVTDDSGKQLLVGGSRTIQFWALGRRYTDEQPKGALVMGTMQPPKKDKSLLYGNDMNFFESNKPQYWNQDASKFLNVLDYGVNNDASYPNNNMKNINKALLDSAGLNKILVFPAGVYKVDDTIFIPPGARVVGVLWSQIMAIGKAFSNLREPKAVLQVGKAGDKGIVEISDITLTNEGPTAGAKFIQWSIHEDGQGSAAIWDTIVRVGGAMGTGLTETTCHQFGKQQKEKCMASTIMLHVTTQASIYMENVWLWVADHDIDSKDQTRVNVYGARGALIESQGPSWFHSVSTSIRLCITGRCLERGMSTWATFSPRHHIFKQAKRLPKSRLCRDLSASSKIQNSQIALL
ncbi:pectin lyase-like protein [Tothia fuscella]|uniref:Pectin lyase-like protein n=1 Tax=Tothia fuscella TaxID=1048955 RepID=A0A9P4NGX4_9PEZI|nr:pectin lyase-like protein [Tothia fuscella]